MYMAYNAEIDNGLALTISDVGCPQGMEGKRGKIQITYYCV
jgi:hypothetical protein